MTGREEGGGREGRMRRKVVKNVEGLFKTVWLVGRREEFYIIRTVAKEVKKAVIVLTFYVVGY